MIKKAVRKLQITQREILKIDRLTFVNDKDRHDKAVDGDDTRHDHWEDSLHDEVWSHDTHGCYPHSTFSRAIGCSYSWWGGERERERRNGVRGDEKCLKSVTRGGGNHVMRYTVMMQGFRKTQTNPGHF